MYTRIEVLWCNYNSSNVSQQILTEHHHSCYQMYYILSGRMDFSVFGDTFPASEGSYLVIPANTPHATPYCAPDTACYELKFLIKDPFLVSHFARIMCQHAFPCLFVCRLVSLNEHFSTSQL